MFRAVLVLTFTVCVFFSLQINPAIGERPTSDPRIDLQGLRAMLDENKVKVIILNFWLPDCPNCIRAAPFMNKMYSKYRKKGLLIIGLSADDDMDDAREFARVTGVRYPTFVADDDIMKTYGLQYVPYYVYIDKKGKARYREAGFYNDKKKEIEEKIVKLLKRSG